MSSDNPATPLLVKRAATIAIHEIGHNCGLDHHGYDEGIACVMADHNRRPHFGAAQIRERNWQQHHVIS
jgi:hypothetical protein